MKINPTTQSGLDPEIFHDLASTLALASRLPSAPVKHG